MLAVAVTLVATLAGLSAPRPATAQVTRLNLDREVVDGAGTEHLVGTAQFTTHAPWHRIGPGHPEGEQFTVRLGRSCKVQVLVAVRAVASASSAQERAERVTQPHPNSPRVFSVARPHGWVSVQLLAWTGSEVPSALYGIGVVKVDRNRWADVRALTQFENCSAASQTRIARETRDMLAGAHVRATVRPRH